MAVYYDQPDLIGFYLLLDSLHISSRTPAWDTDNNSARGPFKHAFMATLAYMLGPDVFARYFQAFRELPKSSLPRSQQESTDYFYEGLCAASTINLKLLFKRWRVPVSDDAYQRVDSNNYSQPGWLYREGL